jgi:ribonuclease P protein component
MQTFNKSERLCNHFRKEKLFSAGKRFFVFPFGITYLIAQKGPALFTGDGSAGSSKLTAKIGVPIINPCEVLISAPKKVFKNATQRNKVKRLVKEAYRKNKMPLYTFLEEKQMKCLLSLVYTGKQVLPYSEIESKMVVALKKLCDNISEEIAGCTTDTI